jgi:hypothetical protein
MTGASRWLQEVAGADGRPSHAARWLAITSVVEAGAGLVLMVSPSLFIWFLLGAELSEPGRALGRFAGSALLSLGLACWPGVRGEEPTAAALRAMLMYSLLTTIYLLYLGIASDLAGMLLWPAVAFHAAATILLGRAWLSHRQREEARNQAQD